MNGKMNWKFSVSIDSMIDPAWEKAMKSYFAEKLILNARELVNLYGSEFKAAVQNLLLQPSPPILANFASYLWRLQYEKPKYLKPLSKVTIIYREYALGIRDRKNPKGKTRAAVLPVIKKEETRTKRFLFDSPKPIQVSYLLPIHKIVAAKGPDVITSKTTKRKVTIYPPSMYLVSDIDTPMVWTGRMLTSIGPKLDFLSVIRGSTTKFMTSFKFGLLYPKPNYPSGESVKDVILKHLRQHTTIFQMEIFNKEGEREFKSKPAKVPARYLPLKRREIKIASGYIQGETNRQVRGFFVDEIQRINKSLSKGFVRKKLAVIKGGASAYRAEEMLLKGDPKGISNTMRKYLENKLRSEVLRKVEGTLKQQVREFINTYRFETEAKKTFTY